MCHYLVVEDFVEDFCNDREEGDWAVVCWECDVRFLVQLDHFRDFETVRILMFVNALVVEACG